MTCYSKFHRKLTYENVDLDLSHVPILVPPTDTEMGVGSNRTREIMCIDVAYSCTEEGKQSKYCVLR
jgi:hypothetical protein